MKTVTSCPGTCQHAWITKPGLIRKGERPHITEQQFNTGETRTLCDQVFNLGECKLQVSDAGMTRSCPKTALHHTEAELKMLDRLDVGDRVQFTSDIQRLDDGQLVFRPSTAKSQNKARFKNFDKQKVWVVRGIPPLATRSTKKARQILLQVEGEDGEIGAINPDDSDLEQYVTIESS